MTQSTRGQNSTGSGIGEPMEWAPRLASMLDEQRRVCLELEGLSLQQGERIREGDTGSLMRILAERQELINRLSVLNGEMEPFRREWSWCMERLGAAEREAIEGAARELGALVDRISASDEADRRALEEQRTAVSAELTSLSRGRVAVSAYGAKPAAVAPMYQDRSC
jgi:hypothetical protein